MQVRSNSSAVCVLALTRAHTCAATSNLAVPRHTTIRGVADEEALPLLRQYLAVARLPKGADWWFEAVGEWGASAGPGVLTVDGVTEMLAERLWGDSSAPDSWAKHKAAFADVWRRTLRFHRQQRATSGTVPSLAAEAAGTHRVTTHRVFWRLLCFVVAIMLCCCVPQRQADQRQFQSTRHLHRSWTRMSWLS